MSSDLNTIEVLVPFRHCPTSNNTGACSQRHPTGGPTPSLQGLGGTHALCSRRNTRQWPSLKPGLPFPGLVPAPPSCSLFSDHHGGSWKPCGSLRSHWQSVCRPHSQGEVTLRIKAVFLSVALGYRTLGDWSGI